MSNRNMKSHRMLIEYIGIIKRNLLVVLLSDRSTHVHEIEDNRRVGHAMKSTRRQRLIVPLLAVQLHQFARLEYSRNA